jgi:hypothetical protein
MGRQKTKVIGYRIPRQWKHWVRTCGLKPGGKFKPYYWQYLSDKTLLYRVNCDMLMDIAAKDGFDRWANSRYNVSWIVPKSLQEFRKFVSEAKAYHDRHVREIELLVQGKPRFETVFGHAYATDAEQWPNSSVVCDSTNNSQTDIEKPGG